MTPFAIPYPQIDPVIFSIPLGSFEFALRWYALAYIAGLLAAWWIVARLMRWSEVWPGGQPPMTPKQPEDLLTWMTVGVILGGRLGYVLFYNPAYYAQHPLQILQLWEGGMAFHGGMLGVVLALVLWCRANAIPLLQAGDAVCLAVPVGLFFGRIANFINGELWGRTTDVPWAMVFPGAGPEPRHPSQLYEAGLEGLALGALLWWLALSRGWLKRPGAIAGTFLLGYGAARAFVENFRQWDAHIGYAVEIGSGGLTMGQLLSLPMILAGLALLLNTRRRAPE